MNQIVSPIVEYGWQGLCGVLLAILVWVISKLLGTLERNTGAITQNTEVIRKVDEHVMESRKLNIEIKDKLNSRPCIASRER